MFFILSVVFGIGVILMFLWMGAWDLVMEEESEVTGVSKETELSEKTE